MTDPTIGQLVTFATIVAGFLYQFVTQGRQRKWDLEDRRQTADRLALKVDVTTAGLHTAIAENTATTSDVLVAAKEAFQEANSVNEKIQQIGLANKTVLDHLTNGKKKP